MGQNRSAPTRKDLVEIDRTIENGNANCTDNYCSEGFVNKDGNRSCTISADCVALKDNLCTFEQYTNNLSKVNPASKIDFPKVLREKAQKDCEILRGTGEKCVRAEKFLFDPNDGSVASIVYRCPVKN